MAWKNLNLACKIVIGLAIMILIGVLGLLNGYKELNSIHVQTERTLLAVTFADTLSSAEIAHLTWANRVAVQLLQGETKALNVTADGRACDFGKWYYGSNRSLLEERIPSLTKVLQSLDKPHLELHNSAELISKQLEIQNTLEAVKIFNTVTLPRLTEIRTDLNKAKETLNMRIIDINKELMDQIDTSQNTSLLTVLALILMGTICSYALAKSITTPVNQLVNYAEDVASGHLVQPRVDRKDEVGRLAQAMGRMVTTLQEKIEDANQKTLTALQKEQESVAAQERIVVFSKNIDEKHKMLLTSADRLSDVIGIVSSAADQLSAQIHQCAVGSSHAASNLTSTSTEMGRMNNMVMEVARNSSDSAEITRNARDKAEEGAKIVQSSLASITAVQKDAATLKTDMQELGIQAQNITQIMGVISDIADQTNLLALNAAIEAARAGDAGRGFAVVADEVRKLAEKTMVSTTEVSKAIRAIQASAEKSMQQVDSTVKQIEGATEQSQASGDALHTIVNMIDTASARVQGIAAAADQQSATSATISNALVSINTVAQESTVALKEAGLAISEIAKQTHVLSDLISAMRKE